MDLVKTTAPKHRILRRFGADCAQARHCGRSRWRPHLPQEL